MSLHHACVLASFRCLLAGLVMLCAPHSRGADFFVAPSGNDAADGSLGTPFQTITKALSLAQPGDAVKLRAGTYRELVSAVRSGTTGSPITIENHNGEEAIISAFDVVPGPWTPMGGGVFATTVSGSRPVSFWTPPGTSANGTGMVDSGGYLIMTVANESTGQGTSVRSTSRSAAWDFFSAAVTWKVRGLSAANTGTTAMPASNMNLFLSIASGATTGFAADDAVNVAYRGDGRIALNVKKNTVNSWGTALHTHTDVAVNGYDLTLGPASAGTVPYTFTVKKSAGPDVVFTGSWTIAQSEWSDGGTGNTSSLSLFAQENVATTDATQKFTMTVDSYTVTKGATLVLRDEFDDADLGTVTEFPSAIASALSSGYDQVFVDGIMQDEARMPNKGAGTLMAPTTANVTVTNASAGTNPNTISSTTFGGQAANFFAGARFVGGIGVKWSWQNAVIASSAGNLLTVDPATKSIWWWPDYTGTSNTSDTGTGYVYGLLSLLDADGEWFLNQLTATLSLRIAGAADPTTHLVEIKRRNWCVNVNGFNYITVRGLKTIGGAIRLNGTGNVLENCDASYLSHFLVWASGSASNGGKTEGGGVVVSGTGNTVRSCTIHDTAGSGIQVTGNDHLIARNHLYNIDYSGTYAAPLSLSGTENTAAFNTIHDAGRDGIRPTGSGLVVMFNDISYAGRLCHDTAAIYTYGTEAQSASGQRTRIAYNWVHDRGDATDALSKGIYLDNGCRNFVVDHNVTWNLSNAAVRFNSPTFGHTADHNTVIGTGSYNDNTWSNFEATNTTYGGLVFTDATHGMEFLARNNMNVPSANTATAFENFATRDFRPKAGYTFTDKRSGSTSAVNPAASSNSVEWVKPAGNTNLTNAYITLAMADSSLSFFYREAFGQGQGIAEVNAWVPDGKPDSGAYERGVARWIPGVNGWEGMKADPPVGIGARTAIVQGVRISLDTVTAPTVTLYLGTTDGGTNPAAWDDAFNLGTTSPGDVLTVFRRSLAGLTPGTTYYMRFLASTGGNGSGPTWSDVQSFTTATSLTWDAGGGATTNISTNTNWAADVSPDLANGGEIPTFGSAGSTATIDTPVSLLGLAINRDANFTLANGAGSLTLGANGITVTLPTTTGRTHQISESDLTLAANQTWSITNNTGVATLNVSSAISGAFGFTKTGSGNLSLGGDSSFDGAVNVNSGVVTISHGNALGSTVGATTLAVTGTPTTGAQLVLSGGISSPENITITGTTEAGNFARAIDNTIGTNALTGSITLVGSGQVRLGATAGVMNLNGPIVRNGADSGPLMLAASAGAVVNVAQPIDLNGGAFNITGPGTVVLAASSTDLGTTTIFFGSPAANGPTLELGANNALPTNRNLVLGTTGTSNGADRGTLDLAGFNQTVNALTGSVGTGATPSAASTRRITNSATGTLSTLTVGNGNASSAFNGLIENGAGQVALTKVGTGTLTLPTANTYTGDTTVTGGTLSVATASFAPTSAVNLSTGAVLNLNFTGTNNITTLRINGLVQAPGTWGSLTSTAAHKTTTITGSGLLNVTGAQPPYDAWALTLGLDNSSAARDATHTGDPDADGLSNLAEFVLGTQPNPANASANSTTSAPTATATATHFIFTFRRNDAAFADPQLSIAVKSTVDFVQWNPVQHAVNGVEFVITDNGFAPGIDRVEVRIPRTGHTRLLLRLEATFN